MKLLSKLLLGAVLLIATSCTSTKKIVENLEVNQQSISYIMDSEKGEKTLTASIAIKEINISNSIPKYTSVSKQSAWVIPLVFVNVWESKKMCYQGESMYSQSWEKAFRENFTKESERSGNYSLDNIGDNYQLIFSIDTISAVGPYVSKGTAVFALFFYVYTFGDFAGPAQTNLAVSYELLKNGEKIHAGDFHSGRTIGVLKTGYKSNKKLIQGFATSMADANSENFKVVISAIVKDLNERLNLE